MVSASSTGSGGDNSIVATTSAISASTAGSMSIVQFQLPTNQSASTAAATMVQSVIQPNHQSVIQPTNPISTIQVNFFFKFIYSFNLIRIFVGILVFF